MDRVDLAVGAAREVVGLQRPVEVRAILLLLMVVFDLQIAVMEQALRDDEIVRLVAAGKERRTGQSPGGRAKDHRACEEDEEVSGVVCSFCRPGCSFCTYR